MVGIPLPVTMGRIKTAPSSGIFAVQTDRLLLKLRSYELPCQILSLRPGDVGPKPVTKFSGSPWWPAGTKRPQCVNGHLMAFIAQVRIDEVPGFDQPPTLLSFHYCEECALGGNMAWGWSDKGKQERYRITTFIDLECDVDNLGIVAPAPIAAQLVSSQGATDGMNIFDIWRRFPSTAKPGGLRTVLPLLAHEDRAKLGGWPSWAQETQRPKDDMDNKMDFVAQLDGPVSRGCAWETGYAYLFATNYPDEPSEGELVIQTT